MANTKSTITGTDQNDTINAGAGNDTINAGAGNDTINAGAGDDTINAGAGDDIIHGGAGNDIINAGDGDDRIIIDHDDLSYSATFGYEVAGYTFRDRTSSVLSFDGIDGGSGADIILIQPSDNVHDTVFLNGDLFVNVEEARVEFVQGVGQFDAAFCLVHCMNKHPRGILMLVRWKFSQMMRT